MKKILIVAHYSRFLVQFELNDVKLLQGMGYEVHYATNFEHEDMYADAVQVIREHGVILHQVDFVRSPYNILANVKAYKQLKHLMQTEMFAGVHCHTPMAGALARLAANATHTAPVLYTAHVSYFKNVAYESEYFESIKRRLILEEINDHVALLEPPECTFESAKVQVGFASVQIDEMTYGIIVFQIPTVRPAEAETIGMFS